MLGMMQDRVFDLLLLGDGRGYDVSRKSVISLNSSSCESQEDPGLDSLFLPSLVDETPKGLYKARNSHTTENSTSPQSSKRT